VSEQEVWNPSNNSGDGQYSPGHNGPGFPPATPERLPGQFQDSGFRKDTPKPAVSKPGLFQSEMPSSRQDGPQVLRRGVDASTVTSIMAGIPKALMSLLVVLSLWALLLLIMRADFGNGFLVALGPLLWVASGALTVQPQVQPAIAKFFFRFREPTNRERGQLEPLWQSVLERAGQTGQGNYRLWLDDTDELNAAAAGGSIVAVTRGAMRYGERELAAILAHELGHHLGGHSWSRLLMYWYSLPYVLTMRAFGFAVRVLAMISPMLALVVFGLGGLTALFVLTFASTYALPLIVLGIAAAVIAPVMDRKAELAADKMAADLGFGPDLIEVFQGWQEMGHDDGRREASWMSLYKASHPSVAKRIIELERYMDSKDPV
jgi:Zn-dependent protease with chaperone function